MNGNQPERLHRPLSGRGRSTALTAATIDKIVLAVRTGAPLEVAAATAGIPRSTFWGWMHRGESGIEPDPIYTELSDRVRVAEAETHMLLVGVVRTAAIVAGNWQAANAYLRMRWSNHYAERLEHTGPGGGPIAVEIAQELEGLSEDDIAALEAHFAGAGPGPLAVGPGGEGETG